MNKKTMKNDPISFFENFLNFSDSTIFLQKALRLSSSIAMEIYWLLLVKVKTPYL